MRNRMKRVILILVLIGIFSVSISNHLPSQVRRVVAIASRNAQFYTEPLEGFRKSCTHNVRSFMLTNDELENSRILSQARNIKPDLILLIGSFAAVKFVPMPTDIPIVYCMILKPANLDLTASNITGVSLEIPYSIKLNYLQRLNPNIQRVGLLYNPNNMSEIADELAKASTDADIELFTASVISSVDISDALKAFKEKDKIEALYLPPDNTLLEKRTFEYITLFSIQNRIALIAPTAKFVKMGGLIAADVDLQGIGHHAGIIANRIIAGEDPSSIPPENPKEFILALNTRVASLIGLKIPPSLMNNAKIYK